MLFQKQAFGVNRVQLCTSKRTFNAAWRIYAKNEQVRNVTLKFLAVVEN